MSLTIYKYEIPRPDEDGQFSMLMPEDARVLSFDCQRDTPCLWAMVLPNAPLVARYFYLIGTGQPLTFDRRVYRFVGTAQMSGGSLVWHVFEHAAR